MPDPRSPMRRTGLGSTPIPPRHQDVSELAALSRSGASYCGLRECECPDWVLRCAHVDRQVLHIIDLAKHVELCECRTSAHHKTWSVSNGLVLGRPGHVTGGIDRFRSDDLPSAIAEFEKRELELLGREA